MYHRPALDSPEFQREHARRLLRYQEMPADEALQRAELTIGSNLDWRRTAEHGVIHIDCVSYFRPLVRSSLKSVANICALQIPFSGTRHEIIQVCGLNAPWIPKHECPVHIMMERTTGRTLDCYVEFHSEKDAREVLHRIKKLSDSGRDPRMGKFVLDITLSSQDALLKAIFPKAKGIEWVKGWPRERANRSQESSVQFDGFLSDEELRFLVRFANEAERVSDLN